MAEEKRRRVHLIRLENLKKIVSEEFADSPGKLAEKLSEVSGKKMQATLINSFLRGKPIGHDMAGKMEQAAGWEEGSLDERQEEKVTAYVLVSIPGPNSIQLFKALREHREVKEISVIYGSSQDVFIKVEAPLRFLERVIMKIIYADGNVRGTRTYVSMKNFCWQREQEARELPKASEELILEDRVDSLPEESGNGKKRLNLERFAAMDTQDGRPVDELFSQYIDYWFNSIKKAQSGEIIVKKEDPLALYPLNFISKIKRSLHATVVWEEMPRKKKRREKRYFEIQKSLREERNTTISRIFVIPDDTEVEDCPELLVRIYKEIEIGITVSYLKTGEWLGNKKNNKPEDFSICDESLVFVYKVREEEPDAMRSAAIYNNKEKVGVYLDLFKANNLYSRHLSPEHIEKAKSLIEKRC